MTNDRVPPVPQKRGTSPWVWVGVGCAGIAVLSLVALGIVGYFSYSKAKDFAREMEDDPIAGMSQLIAAANPDVELVSADKEERIVVFRSTETGEEFTFDYDDIEEGRISFTSGDDTASIEIDPEGGGTSGLTITTDEGRTTYGGASDRPSWLPVYPGSEPQGTYFSEKPDAREGAFTFRAEGELDEVLEFYVSELTSAGFVIENRTTTPDGAVLAAATADESRTVNVAASVKDGGVEAMVSFAEKAR